ncbi:beta-lactamase family protein, partial [bacterium]
PGIAVAIVKGDRLIYAKGFGVKKLGCSDPVDENTVFQVGSVTKSFTSALVSMLVEDDQITWKSKVKDHLPNFRLHDPLATREFTVEDLMSQRSGLPPHAGCLLPHLGFNRAHIMNTLRYIKPASSFRSEYAYQNNLFLAAAALIEKKTGMSWEKNLLTRILKPLGMVNSTATFN